MTIEREDVDQGRVEFPDVASGRALAPVHPGEVLRDEFLIIYLVLQSVRLPLQVDEVHAVGPMGAWLNCRSAGHCLSSGDGFGIALALRQRAQSLDVSPRISS